MIFLSTTITPIPTFQKFKYLKMKISNYLLLLLIAMTIININCTSEQKPVLKTGWYYVVDIPAKGIVQRQLDRGKDLYYLNTQPILTAANFKDVYFYTGFNAKGIRMELNEEGIERWSEATGKWITKYVAFVYDDRLIGTQRVAAQNNNGETIIYKKEYSEAELQKIIDELGFGKKEEN